MIIITLFLLKPYIIGLASVAYRRDRNALIDIFYTDKLIISFEAIATIPLLFLIYAWIRRAPAATQIIKNIWKNGKQLIMATAFLQLCVTSSPLWLPIDSVMTRTSWIQLLLYLLVLIITPLSAYMRECFADFPEINQESI